MEKVPTCGEQTETMKPGFSSAQSGRETEGERDRGTRGPADTQTDRQTDRGKWAR